jgi:hypothetical protein
MNMVGSNIVKVEGMDTVEEHFYPMNHRLEVECTDTVEEHFHPMNHRPELEGINTAEEHFHPMNHRPEVEGMDMVEVHFHLMNHRPEVEGIDMVEEHFHPMNHRPKVEGMDTVDTGMGEDRAAELEVVERESEGAILVRHWIGDGAARHHRTHREWEDLVKPGCSKDQYTFVTQDSNCSSP